MTHLHNAPIAVVGGGSWATALVKILSEQAGAVHWWLRDTEALTHIQQQGRNPSYLSAVTIDTHKVLLFSDLKQAVSQAAAVIVAVPAAFVEAALAPLVAEDLAGKVLISAVKGVVPARHQLVTSYLQSALGVPFAQQAVIAGPCHAEEVALEKQSYLTIAAATPAIAEAVAQRLSCAYIKATPHHDWEGIEYAAVMKNIIALACGIAHGHGYGDNFQAVLVSNAMQEIAAFLQAISPTETRNLSTSAYLGDLLVTAYSQFSRNRTFGNMIGRGYTVQSAQVELGMIAEGYYAVQSIQHLRQPLDVMMPITEMVYGVLYERRPVKEAMQHLAQQLY
ncbi:NAD(P)H-dependent glycerol-3-phosphate dehydrogenase [Eisenibacter elegans]|jgi:glycerol-3-phosphate dehydrogenase (NAD(P)+)|uniref:NAD(P)H-dependent glycerol-3-phosphate dehydrogenase n=1 Tax=Eisenibacter elegans TaxID=997 RepID=UPI000415771D|nr:NAD(P)H-dependent glycerol-3-phosphate dehydrogenase [Eisenibacter elegans]